MYFFERRREPFYILGFPGLAWVNEGLRNMPGTGEVEAWKKNTWASPFDLPPFVQLYLTCISVAGIYLKKRAADGFPMKAVGNDRFFSASSPVVQRHPFPLRHTCVSVAGIHLKKEQQMDSR
jgi:hypothetical protein